MPDAVPLDVRPKRHRYEVGTLHEMWRWFDKCVTACEWFQYIPRAGMVKPDWDNDDWDFAEAVIKDFFGMLESRDRTGGSSSPSEPLSGTELAYWQQVASEQTKPDSALAALTLPQGERYPRVEVSGNRGPAYVYFGPIKSGEVAVTEQVSDLINVDLAEDGRLLGVEVLDPTLVNWSVSLPQTGQEKPMCDGAGWLVDGEGVLVAPCSEGFGCNTCRPSKKECDGSGIVWRTNVETIGRGYEAECNEGRGCSKCRAQESGT